MIALYVWTTPKELELIRMWNEEKKSIGVLMAHFSASKGTISGKIERLRRKGVDMRYGLPGNRLSSNRGGDLSRRNYKIHRNEERVDEFTRVGLSQVQKFEACMPKKGIPLLEIRAFQCRFPTSNGPDWLMCGETSTRGSYCNACANRTEREA